MRIGLAQINPVMGDIDGNAQKIHQYMERARDKHCNLVVFPELALLGYNPNDLLERPEVVKSLAAAVKNLKKKKPTGLNVVFGSVAAAAKDIAKPLHNAAIVFAEKDHSVFKTHLPSYDIFDETRFFTPGPPDKHLVKIGGKNVLILVCEDIWSWERKEHADFLRLYKNKKVDLILSINGSPFTLSKIKRRRNVVALTARYLKAPVVYVNCVGGQDEVIYDGGSFAVDRKGEVIAQSAYFSEDLNVIDLEKSIGGQRFTVMTENERLHQALVLGVRDFAHKNKFQKIHLGVSGGIDSAIVLALACDAIGPRNVTGIAMPGPFSAGESESEARKLCERFGCHFHTMNISDSYTTMLNVFETVFGAQDFGVLNENIQARLRGMYLMMYSNRVHSLLLATSNKSEMATGYSTLYGDMCGGLAPIGDLLKHQVYDLARVYNREVELIPNRIIERPPTAELRPGQTDQDTLPPYDDLDQMVQNLVEHKKAATDKNSKWVLKRMATSEFKRWQAPPILKVSDHAFGRGRRLPITNRYYDKF